MPLTLRTVEPTDVSLNRIPEPIPGRRIDELQCVANGTLSNMMRQLGTLSSHGAQLFEDLNRSLESIDRRLEALGLRSTTLQEKIQLGAASGQDGGLHENLRRKPYQTANDIDQHSLSRQTLPAAMMELYNQCDAPPRLRDLDQFREDGKSALKFYTDPGYFFELWKEQILKECQNDRRMRSARVSAAAANLPPGQKSPAKRRRNMEPQQQRRGPHNSQVLLNNYSYSAGYHEYRSVSGILRPAANEFVQFPTEYQAPQISRYNRNAEIPTGMSRPHIQQKLSASNLYDDEPLPPPPLNYRPPQVTTTSQPPYPQPQNNGFHHGHQTVPATNASTPSADGSDLVQAMGGMHVGQQHQLNNQVISGTNSEVSFAGQQILHIDDDDQDELPPPPPPLNSSSSNVYSASNTATNLQFLAPTAVTEPTQVAANVPPVLQPTPAIDSSLINSSFQRDAEESVQVAGPGEQNTSSASGQPARLTLEEEVRARPQLRKVQREEQARVAEMQYNTVAALLHRRMALGYKQDESTDDEEGTQDGHDSEWDD